MSCRPAGKREEMSSAKPGLNGIRRSSLPLRSSSVSNGRQLTLKCNAGLLNNSLRMTHPIISVSERSIAVSSQAKAPTPRKLTEVLPEVSEIKSAYSGDTKIGQLHSMMTAIYTALHCNGNDGITDKNTWAQAGVGMEHTALLSPNVIKSKASIINMMKMQAGLIPGNQAEYQRESESVESFANEVSAWKGGFNNPVANRGEYLANAAKRIALGLRYFLTYLKSNPKSLRSPTAKKTIAEFDSSFSDLFYPEIVPRTIRWGIGPKKELSTTVYFDRTDLDAYFRASRLCASYNSFKTLFGDKNLPKISAWIPFKDSAMPEYRIWYADQKKEFTIPL